LFAQQRRNKLDPVCSEENPMADMTRRQFLKVTGITLAGSSLALIGFSPTPALADVRAYKLSRATETRNTCP
jgi:formate dehydrogenase major subunit